MSCASRIRIAAVVWWGGLMCIGAGSATAQRQYPDSHFFHNRDAHLSYVIDVPSGAGPHPGIVLGHGSGHRTKEELAGMARQFVRRGFAVLRFTKRGVAPSTGEYADIGPGNSERMFEVLASDMVAAAVVLRRLASVDPDRIGLAGASQAGWIIPVAASQDSTLSFALILAGPTVSVGLEIFYSRFTERTTTPLGEVSQRLPEYEGPHGFDPLPTLEGLTLPMLWLYGALDRSIPTKECVKVLESLLERTPKPFTFIVYPAGNHALRDARTGASIDYWSDVDEWLEAIRVAPVTPDR